MFKKIFLGIVFTGLIGVLIYGAINRTVDKTTQVAEANGRGQGANGTEQGRATSDQAPAEWLVYKGLVVQVPGSGADMILATEEGELVVGLGPIDLVANGLNLARDDTVQVSGYWEDGEFKAGQITRLADGVTLTVRDTAGRPVWSGGTGQGRAGNSQDGNGQGTGLAAEPGVGQAQVDSWVQLQGIVVTADADGLAIALANGEEFLLEGRAWRFAQEQGFSAEAGHSVMLTGFYEDGELEVSQIDNLSTALTTPIRDETGRPLWAGGGRYNN
jgi:hypothetical protein